MTHKVSFETNPRKYANKSLNALKPKPLYHDTPMISTLMSPISARNAKKANNILTRRTSETVAKPMNNSPTQELNKLNVLFHDAQIGTEKLKKEFEVQQAQRQNLEEENRHLNKKIAEVEANILNSQMRINSLLEEKRELSAKNEQLQRNVDEANESIRHLNKEALLAKQRIQMLESNANSATLSPKISNLESEFARLRTHKEGLEAKLAEAMEELKLKEHLLKNSSKKIHGAEKPVDDLVFKLIKLTDEASNPKSDGSKIQELSRQIRGSYVSCKNIPRLLEKLVELVTSARRAHELPKHEDLGNGYLISDNGGQNIAETLNRINGSLERVQHQHVDMMKRLLFKDPNNSSTSDRNLEQLLHALCEGQRETLAFLKYLSQEDRTRPGDSRRVRIDDKMREQQQLLIDHTANLILMSREILDAVKYNTYSAQTSSQKPRNENNLYGTSDFQGSDSQFNSVNDPVGEYDSGPYRSVQSASVASISKALTTHFDVAEELQTQNFGEALKSLSAVKENVQTLLKTEEAVFSSSTASRLVFRISGLLNQAEAGLQAYLSHQKELEQRLKSVISTYLSSNSAMNSMISSKQVDLSVQESSQPNYLIYPSVSHQNSPSSSHRRYEYDSIYTNRNLPISRPASMYNLNKASQMGSLVSSPRGLSASKQSEISNSTRELTTRRCFDQAESNLQNRGLNERKRVYSQPSIIVEEAANPQRKSHLIGDSKTSSPASKSTFDTTLQNTGGK